MYFSDEEREQVEAASSQFRTVFRHYRYATWFTSWSDRALEDAALRWLIGSGLQVGTPVAPHAYTALAKYHAALAPNVRFVAFARTPLGPIATALDTLSQYYRRRWGSFVSEWPNSSNELVVAALAVSAPGVAVVPRRELYTLVRDVKQQLGVGGTIRCQCGMTKVRGVCQVCGHERRTSHE